MRTTQESYYQLGNRVLHMVCISWFGPNSSSISAFEASQAEEGRPKPGQIGRVECKVHPKRRHSRAPQLLAPRSWSLLCCALIIHELIYVMPYGDFKLSSLPSLVSSADRQLKFQPLMSFRLRSRSNNRSVSLYSHPPPSMLGSPPAADSSPKGAPSTAARPRS